MCSWHNLNGRCVSDLVSTSPDQLSSGVIRGNIFHRKALAAHLRKDLLKVEGAAMPGRTERVLMVDPLHAVLLGSHVFFSDIAA